MAEGKTYRTAYIFDLDRTLVDTSKITNEFLSYLHAIDTVAARDIQTRRVEMEAHNESLDLGMVLRQIYGGKAEDYMRDFVRLHAGRDFLMEGAAKLVTYIKESPFATFGILTYGGRQWQKAKLKLCGFENDGVLIVPEPGQKGQLITSWYDTELKRYVLPLQLDAVNAHTVVFVDDKPSEFQAFPKDQSARGYLLQPASGAPQPNVYVVASLSEVMRQESEFILLT